MTDEERKQYWRQKFQEMLDHYPDPIDAMQNAFHCGMDMGADRYLNACATADAKEKERHEQIRQCAKKILEIIGPGDK